MHCVIFNKDIAADLLENLTVKNFHNRLRIKGTLHSVEKTLIQKAYCVYYHILKERRIFYVD